MELMCDAFQGLVCSKKKKILSTIVIYCKDCTIINIFFLEIRCETLVKGPKSTFYAIIMFCETEVKKKAVSCSDAGTSSGVVPVKYIA